MRAAQAAWRSYAGSGATTRAFLAARLAVAPLADLEQELRGERGRVLSAGCGFGIVDRYLAEAIPAIEIEGIERDPRRVEVAAATAARAPRVRVRHGDVLELDEPREFDAALAVDMLHHVLPDEQEGVLRALVRSLRPGSLCLINDIATAPRWQYTWNLVHDRLVAGPEPIHCRSPEGMAELMEAAGLVVEASRRVRRLDPYPHYTLRARAPGA